MLLAFSSYLFDSGRMSDPLPILMMAAANAVSGLLVLPSAIFSLMRLLGRESEHQQISWHTLRPTLLIFVLPFILMIGQWAIGIPGIAPLIIPPLHVLAIGIPVLWILYIGVRDLPLGSKQRAWGVFSSGLVLGPTLILILEGLAGLLFLVMGILYISSNPTLTEHVLQLGEWMRESNPTPELVLEKLSPFLSDPVVIFSIFTFAAVIVPMIEEAFKPIGVWLLAGRKMSQGAGFAAGALSGAGYALFESLALASNGDTWMTVVIARIGTAVIHILTTALTGRAIVIAWSKKRYIQLGVTYLVVVMIHGFWNATSLLTATSTLADFNAFQDMNWTNAVGTAAGIILGILTIGSFAVMFQINRSLANQPETLAALEKKHPQPSIFEDAKENI